MARCDGGVGRGLECEQGGLCGWVYEEWGGGREGEVLWGVVDDCALCFDCDEWDFGLQNRHGLNRRGDA